MKRFKNKMIIVQFVAAFSCMLLICCFFIFSAIKSKAALDFSSVGYPYVFNYSVTTPSTSRGALDFPLFVTRNEVLVGTYGSNSSSFFMVSQPTNIPGTVYNGFSLESVSTSEPRSYTATERSYLTVNLEVVFTLWSETIKPYFGSSSSFSDQVHLELYLSDDRSQYIDFIPNWIPSNSLSSDQSSLEFSALIGAYVDPGSYNIYGWKLFLPCNIVCTGPTSQVYIDYSIQMDNPPGLDFTPYVPPEILSPPDTSDEVDSFNDSLTDLNDLRDQFNSILQSSDLRNSLFVVRSLFTDIASIQPVRVFLILSLAFGTFALILNGVIAYVKSSSS